MAGLPPAVPGKGLVQLPGSTIAPPIPGQQLSICHDPDAAVCHDPDAAVGVTVGILHGGEHPVFQDHPVSGARALACPGSVAGQRP